MALLRGDYAAAEQALIDLNLQSLTGPENVLNEPVSLHRALVAFLSGRPDEAATFADQAIPQGHPQFPIFAAPATLSHLWTSLRP